MRLEAKALVAFIGFCMAPCHGATPMSAAGEAHSLALHAGGTVRSWGNDGEGELGIGSVLFSRTPRVVGELPPIRSDPASIAAGSHHALAIARDGSVWAWGSNLGGQLGDGSYSDRSKPVRVSGLANAVAVAGGFTHSLAITEGGAVYTWGANGQGQLGAGNAQREGRALPARINIGPAVAVSAGWRHSLVLLADGTVWAFGENNAGQIGDGSLTRRTAPVRVPGLSGVVAISAGAFQSLALRDDGTVWAWGLNDEGQLGDGTTTNRLLPVRIPDLAGVVRIAAGLEFASSSVALMADGTVRAWGPRRGLSPSVVTGYTQVTQIDTGNNFTVAVRAGGAIWTEGTDNYGTLGREAPAGPQAPGVVAGLSGISAVAAGSFFAMAVRDDGSVHTWGDNTEGQLGAGRTLNRTSPARVPALESVSQIAAGGLSVALKSDGTVATWGSIGERTSSPRPVASLSNIVQVAAGETHGVALGSDGMVWTWGFNDYGQLGWGPSGDFGSLTPRMVQGLSGVVRVAASRYHTAAVRGDGTVWVWGRNEFDALGVPASATCLLRASRTSVPCTPLPTQVPGIGSVVGIATSWEHFLALRGDGTVWSWGNNERGALGRGLETYLTTPAPIPDLSDVIQVAAGGECCGTLHSAALKRDGTVWTWGDNTRGQLGDGTREFRKAPRPVDELSRITHLSAGNRHVLAVRSDGVLWAWGGNNVGQLGDGTVADRFKPVIVLREEGAGSFEAGDWFLDLDPAVGEAVALDKAFPLVADGSIGELDATVTAQMRFRAGDTGTTGSVYVFALAPPSAVMNVAKEDAPLSCVLAQLSSTGQLVAVSASSLQAYVTGVLSSQGQAVTIVNGVPVANIGGATFYVGYGATGSSMLSNGTTRSVATIPGQVQCKPQAPKTGWWWNPDEGGRGYSIEVRGTNLFFASFLYEVSGRSTWYVATGPVALDGSLFQGALLSARGGQALGGTYPGFPALTNAGPITLAFNDASTGTLVWSGGVVPIQRFNVVPNGLNLPPVPNQPETGWWWNEAEAGRGFFLEWQGGILNIAGYMYDDAGEPVWYLTQNSSPTTNAQQFSSSWWSFANGMTLMGPWKPHQLINNNVAPVTIQFSGPDTAIMTLPNGRTTALTRHRF